MEIEMVHPKKSAIEYCQQRSADHAKLARYIRRNVSDPNVNKNKFTTEMEQSAIWAEEARKLL